MKNTRWTVWGVALGALAAGLVVALHAPTPTPGPEQQLVPTSLLATEWKDLDGQPQSLAQFKGKLLVLNFWATWCAPCVDEMPDLQRIQAEYAARGVVIVGMGIDAVPAMRRFRDEHKLDFTLLATASGGTEIARELGNASGALPFTVLIDGEGRIAQRRLGRISAAELRLWLDAKLRSQPG